MATITERRAGPSGDAAASDTAVTHPYTCNSCQVAFRNSDLQKGHMKGDWHRYNLKRRVASLPPISSEVFTEKVLQARAASSAEANKAGFEKVCDVCQKSYYSENSFQNHIGSAKHKAREGVVRSKPNGVTDDEVSSMMSSTFSLGEPVGAKPEVDSGAEEEFAEVIEGLKKTGLQDHTTRPSPVKRPSNPHHSAAGQHKSEHRVSENSSEVVSSSATPSSNTPAPSKTSGPVPSLKSCLFCSYESPSVPLNVTHMERIHGMLIPEQQYLINLDGLISALHEHVFELSECVFCGKVKANVFAVQTHMRDTGHCKIPYTTEDEQLEIGEFYDFRSTYSDGEGSDDESMTDAEPKGGAKLGVRRAAKVTAENGDEIMQDGREDGWETDSSASSLDSEDLHAVPAEQHYHQYERLDRHPHHSSAADPRSRHQRDGWHSHAHKPVRAAFYDDYELHLPSGRSVGHRSMNRYYRQNLHNHPSPAEREEQHRLAIEAGESAMDVDGNQGVATRGRAMISRSEGGLGMLGVSDQKKRNVRRLEARGRNTEDVASRKRQWALNKQANHQKYFHYSIL